MPRWSERTKKLEGPTNGIFVYEYTIGKHSLGAAGYDEERYEWRSATDIFNGAPQLNFPLRPDCSPVSLVVYPLRSSPNYHRHIHPTHWVFLSEEARVYSKGWHKNRDQRLGPESTSPYICATNMDKYCSDGIGSNCGFESCRQNWG